jgi:hypothetical protein
VAAEIKADGVRDAVAAIDSESLRVDREILAGHDDAAAANEQPRICRPPPPARGRPTAQR